MEEKDGVVNPAFRLRRRQSEGFLPVFLGTRFNLRRVAIFLVYSGRSTNLFILTILLLNLETGLFMPARYETKSNGEIMGKMTFLDAQISGGHNLAQARQFVITSE